MARVRLCFTQLTPFFHGRDEKQSDQLTHELTDRALVLHSQVQALPAACARDLRTLKEWLARREGGDFFLRGREAGTYDCKDDFLTLSSRQADKDSLTAFVNESVIPFYHGLSCRWNRV